MTMSEGRPRPLQRRNSADTATLDMCSIDRPRAIETMRALGVNCGPRQPRTRFCRCGGGPHLKGGPIGSLHINSGDSDLCGQRRDASAKAVVRHFVLVRSTHSASDSTQLHRTSPVRRWVGADPVTGTTPRRTKLPPRTGGNRRVPRHVRRRSAAQMPPLCRTPRNCIQIAGKTERAHRLRQSAIQKQEVLKIGGSTGDPGDLGACCRCAGDIKSHIMATTGHLWEPCPNRGSLRHRSAGPPKSQRSALHNCSDGKSRVEVGRMARNEAAEPTIDDRSPAGPSAAN